MRSHRVADIAEQAGLSEATVDRVLHGRPGASPRAVRAVEQAVAELDRQASALRLGARSLVLDVVMQAPDRFSGEVTAALESQLSGLRPAAVRARVSVEAGSALTWQGIVGDAGRTVAIDHFGADTPVGVYFIATIVMAALLALACLRYRVPARDEFAHHGH